MKTLFASLLLMTLPLPAPTAQTARAWEGHLPVLAWLSLAESHPGFWIADARWYRRCNGSHPYIVGNTHYTFLSRRRSSQDPRGFAIDKTPVESIQLSPQSGLVSGAVLTHFKRIIR